MIVEPLGALTGWPSTSNSTISAGGAVSFGCALMAGIPGAGTGNGERGTANRARSGFCSLFPVPCSRFHVRASRSNSHFVVKHRVPMLAVVLEFVPEIREE